MAHLQDFRILSPDHRGAEAIPHDCLENLQAIVGKLACTLCGETFTESQFVPSQPVLTWEQIWRRPMWTDTTVEPHRFVLLNIKTDELYQDEILTEEDARDINEKYAADGSEYRWIPWAEQECA